MITLVIPNLEEDLAKRISLEVLISKTYLGNLDFGSMTISQEDSSMAGEEEKAVVEREEDAQDPLANRSLRNGKEVINE